MTEHPEPKESAPTPYSLQDVIERAEEQRATVLAIPRLELAKVVETWAADRALIEHQGREIERRDELLRRIEWVQQWNNSGPSCPSCGEYRHVEGHAEFCQLAAILTESTPS